MYRHLNNAYLDRLGQTYLALGHLTRAREVWRQAFKLYQAQQRTNDAERRIPRMNAIMERWIKTCRHELLNRTLIWNQRHLLHLLREYEQFYNSHRPHQGIANARPLQALPPPITDQVQIIDLDIRRRQRLGGILNEYHHAA